MASLDDLEQRVERLEAAAAAAAQPAYSPLAGLKAQPDGTIAYDFEGHVHAAGVDLDASTDVAAEFGAVPQADKRVAWFTGAKAVAGYVAGFHYGADEGSPEVHNTVQLAARKSGDDGTRLTAFSAIVHDDLANGDRDNVRVHADGWTKVLLDGAGNSDFLQLWSSALSWKIDAGRVSPVLAGTAGTFDIGHRIGRNPFVAFVIPDGAVANDLTVGTSVFLSDRFTVSWRRASGAATNFQVPFYWLALA